MRRKSQKFPMFARKTNIFNLINQLMKRFFTSLLLLAALLLPMTVSAQTINGDLNHNNRLDVADVTLLLNGYLTGTTEEIASSADPFMADNTPIVGTWWKSEKESITFRADGTTDYLANCTYRFLPFQGRVFFFNTDNIPVMTMRLTYVTPDYIVVLPADSDVPVIYYANLPKPVGNEENGHAWVDLGLSVKWATMNVGASSPEDYGDYFAWGETTTKTTYSWSTYKWCNGSSTTLTKYNTNSSNGTVDGKTSLDLSDDAARQNWGGTWRMPTYDELNELRSQCDWTWTTQNGVSGYKVSSKTNGNSIFLPAAGYRNVSSLNGAGTYGSYWSSSLGTSSPVNARNLFFYSSNVYVDSSSRCLGQSVRPVCQ